MADNDCCGDFGFRAWAGKGRRQFRWRVFERGDLKFVILRMVSEKPMHGYEVMRALEEESGGCYKPSPGSVYPTLQMLEDEGLVRSKEEEGGKKTYEITDQGREYIIEYKMEELEEILDPELYFRLNRTFMVNINAIRDVIIHSNSRLKVLLHQQFEKELIVSREKVNAFKMWFGMRD